MARMPPIQHRTFRDIARAAEDFLAAHHDSDDLPIPIEEIIEFEYGIDIVPIPGLLSDLDIDAFITADLKEIRVDQYIQRNIATRYRASLAHELSHCLIHAEFFEQLKFRTIAEWKRILTTLDIATLDRLENQAKLLGALILVPPRHLKKKFDEAVSKVPTSISIDRLTDKAKKIIAGGLAPPFNVSTELMFKRLSQDRLL